MMEKIPDGIMIFFWCPHRVDEGRKGLKSSRDKKASHEPYGGEGRRACYDPGSEIWPGGREKKGEDNKWDGKNKKRVGGKLGECGVYRLRKKGQLINTWYELKKGSLIIFRIRGDESSP